MEEVARLTGGRGADMIITAAGSGKVQEDALRAGYGPTIKAESVKKLVDSVVNFQEKSIHLIAEMRESATKMSRRSVSPLNREKSEWPIWPNQELR